jgi:hypothetical protein
MARKVENSYRWAPSRLYNQPKPDWRPVMPARLSASDPRSVQYKWKRLISKPWVDLDPHRMRRCEQLAARLHSALGRQWDVRRVDGIYRVEKHVDDAGAVEAQVPVVLFAPWKELELVVAFRAAHGGAFEAAAEMSPKVLGMWAGGGPGDHHYCVIVPDEGQEDEILLAVRGFVHEHVEKEQPEQRSAARRGEMGEEAPSIRKPGADAPGGSIKSMPIEHKPEQRRIIPRRARPAQP